MFQFAKLARDLVIPCGMKQNRQGGGSSRKVEPQEEGVASGGNGPTQLDDEELEGGIL